MKKLFLSTLATLFILPTLAEWEPRGLCYVWTGDGKPDSPGDMLTGEIYDYNLSKEGKHFTYSEIYYPDELFTAKQLDVATAQRFRKIKAEIQNRVLASKADNPTNSPDFRGHYISTFKEVMEGRTDVLKKCYKYPHRIAAPHIFMPAASFPSLDAGLGLPATSSDIIAPASAPAGTAKSKTIPSSWIAVFRGKVIAPRSMTFRFFGSAEDNIAVRFNGELVLETGMNQPLIYKGNGIRGKGGSIDSLKVYNQEVAAGKYPERKDYLLLMLKSTPYINEVYGGLMGGTPVTVKKGQTYPIEIIIGNEGGDAFYYLLTQEVTPDNHAPMHLFRTNGAHPTTPSFRAHKDWKRRHFDSGPNFINNSDIWKIAPKAKRKKKKSKRK
ncbi:MAG: hypothetical protein IKK73_01140 [Akkermansia sp.]|nr:hypothetical protein [Akkermansia sp.]